MGLKKRNKVNAEFNMSSLTDIIFLLLIFFMLTSTLVQIKNFDLPKSDVKTVAPASVIVEIEKSGVFSVKGKEVKESALKTKIRNALRSSDSKKDATVTIVAEVGVPFEQVVKIMNIANQLKAKAILATQPK